MDIKSTQYICVHIYNNIVGWKYYRKLWLNCRCATSRRSDPPTPASTSLSARAPRGVAAQCVMLICTWGLCSPVERGILQESEGIIPFISVSGNVRKPLCGNSFGGVFSGYHAGTLRPLPRRDERNDRLCEAASWDYQPGRRSRTAGTRVLVVWRNRHPATGSVARVWCGWRHRSRGE